jgi:molybdopterin-guanine dinucleotide biosynthesis protein A
MPFINADIIRFVCNEHGKISKRINVDATIPVYGNEPQPLFGVYSKTIISRLEKGIAEGKTALKRFLGEINTHFISASDIKAIDFNGRSFVNINTVEDYKAVIRNASA